MSRILKNIAVSLWLLFIASLICSSKVRNVKNLNLRSVQEIYANMFAADSRVLDDDIAGGFAYSMYPNISKINFSFGLNDTQKPLDERNGKTNFNGRFDATSIVQLNPKIKLRGGATYSRSVKKSVKWNSTSDFEFLYPYFLADSVGGDRHYEYYSFNGAYAHTAGRLFYAFSGKYKASHEWGEVDPRPRNIVSDMSLSTSVGYKSRKHMFSLNMAYRVYNQDQNMRFVNPDGANAIEWHLTGIGSHYARFAGNGIYIFTRYEGRGYTANLLMQSLSKTGLNAGITYNNIAINRLLVNQNYTPATNLYKHRAETFFTYRRQSGGLIYGAEVAVAAGFHRGIENISDNGITDNFKVLARLPMYKENLFDGRVSGLVQMTWRRSAVYFSPGVEFNRKLETYKFPAKSMSIARGTGNLKCGLIFSIEKWLLHIEEKPVYSYCYKSKLVNNDELMEPVIRRCLDRQFQIEAMNFFANNIRLSVQRQFQKIGSLGLSLSWTHSRFLDGVKGENLYISTYLIF